MGDPVELTDLQLDVMRVLWDRGGATTAEVHRALADTRGLAFTTVATLLTRMEKRGVVERASSERPFLYRARVSEREVRRSMVGGLVERLFAGDVAATVNYLLGSPGVRAEDLERVQQMLAERRGRGGAR